MFGLFNSTCTWCGKSMKGKGFGSYCSKRCENAANKATLSKAKAKVDLVKYKMELKEAKEANKLRKLGL